MLKVLRHITFLLYSYYSNGRQRNIAYFSAISALTFTTVLNVFEVLLLLGIRNALPIHSSEPRVLKFFKLTLLMLPIFLIYYYSIKEEKIAELKKEYHYEKEFNRRAWVWGYIAFSFVSLMVIVLIKNRGFNR